MTKEFDFIVVGSGAGGMTAALRAKYQGMSVVVVEKASKYGGSTAMSGGGIWLPGNRVLRAAGVQDNVDEVSEYLRLVTQDEVDTKKLQHYAKYGAETIDFLMDLNEHLQFSYCPGYSDYHPELPFGHPNGRSIEPVPFDLKILKGTEKKLLKSAIIPPMGMWISSADYRYFTMMLRTKKGFQRLWNILVRAVKAKFTGKRVVALGMALVARLRKAMLDEQIPLYLDTAMTGLIRKDNRIVGISVSKHGETMEMYARKAVLLACGGFEHNSDFRKRYLPELATDNYSSGSTYNTGDGIQAAQDHGVDTEFMNEAWWMPSIELPDMVFTLVSERAIPNSIIVGPDGKRFTNEASPYVNFVHDQIEAGFKTVWQIMDARFLFRYVYAGKAPGLPIPKSWFRSGVAFKARSIDKLAKKINLDASTLQQSIDRFNQFVDKGEDLDFGRGKSAYDRYYGDPSLDNPVLDHINKGPFYAFKLVMGDIGTKGGIRTDEFGRAICTDGSVLEGLYATGNTSGSVMGRDYAGAGATIGASMTYGFIAANHAVTIKT